MKNTTTIIAVLAIIIIGGYFIMNNSGERKVVVNLPEITPISHATFVLDWGDIVIYNDPVGSGEAFTGFSSPDLILVSDIHGDHLNIETLEAIISNDSVIIAPQAVADNFTEKLLEKTVVVANGEKVNQKDISIEAIPMYNLPESSDNRHIKGRGNGYILEKEGVRVYIAGDTAGISEMRNLKNIDIAFVPMNLPYTMDIEEAASAVFEFKPVKVYPYHYRGQDGLSDVGKFKEIVNTANDDIEVVLLDWYPDSR